MQQVMRQLMLRDEPEAAATQSVTERDEVLPAALEIHPDVGKSQSRI